jgi:hypothetical protein
MIRVDISISIFFSAYLWGLSLFVFKALFLFYFIYKFR